MIDIEVTMSYSCSAFSGEPGLVVQFLLEFLRRLKFSIPERVHSGTNAAILETACLKKFKRGDSSMYDLKLPQQERNTNAVN